MRRCRLGTQRPRRFLPVPPPPWPLCRCWLRLLREVVQATRLSEVLSAQRQGDQLALGARNPPAERCIVRAREAAPA